jgi:streptomycin 6-kinase
MNWLIHEYVPGRMTWTGVFGTHNRADGAALEGGNAAYAAEAVTHDGTPAVLKVPVPPGIDGFAPFDRQLAALQLAGGDPYAGLIRYDVPRRALLLERLGPPMASLGWPASRQADVLARTAARGWRQVPDDGRLPSGAEAARWLSGFISTAWEDLARPCPEAVVDPAVRCAAAREAAFDPGRAVLVHGDVHAFNALQVPGLTRAGAGFGSSTRAFAELVSTGLFLLRLGHHEEAEAFLAVAGKLAAATSNGQPGRVRDQPAGKSPTTTSNQPAFRDQRSRAERSKTDG